MFPAIRNFVLWWTWWADCYDNTETGKESSPWDCWAFHIFKYTHSCVWLYLLSVELTIKQEGNVTNWCLVLPVYHQSDHGLHTITRVITYPVLSSLFWAVPHPLLNSKRTEMMWYLIEQCLEEPKRQAPISITESLHDSWRAPAHCDMFEIILPMTGELCWYQYNSKKLHFMLRIHVIIKIFVIGGSDSSNYEETLLACDTLWSLIILGKVEGAGSFTIGVNF